MINFLRVPSKNKISRILSNELDVRHTVVYPNGKSSVLEAEDAFKGIFLNYDVCGQRWFNMLARYPGMMRKKCVNPWIQINKYHWIEMLKQHNVLIPDTVGNINQIDDLAKWLAKPYYSKGGKGITLAKDNTNSPNHYYQRIVENRIYELRVSFFTWMDRKDWFVWKKVLKNENNEGQLTWNHKTGGTFISINNTNKGVFKRAKDITEILTKFHLSFGAVDFIVDNNMDLWFLEVNTSPGFSSKDNKEKYVQAFKQLTLLNEENQIKFCKTI